MSEVDEDLRLGRMNIKVCLEIYPGRYRERKQCDCRLSAECVAN